jgi:hypothetical protein
MNSNNEGSLFVDVSCNLIDFHTGFYNLEPASEYILTPSPEIAQAIDDGQC